jgi:hypothetical protein
MENDRGTVESRYDGRVKELLEKDPEAAFDYILRAMPLIQEYTQDIDDATNEKRSHLDTFGFTVTATSSKNEVFCKYMAEVEDDYTFYYANQPKKKASARGQDASAQWICGCGGTKTFDRAQAQTICEDCGLVEAYMEMNQHNLSFDEQVNMEVSNNCMYKRVNHFRVCFTLWRVKIHTKLLLRFSINYR